jgi:hypothetical protein
LAYDIDGLIHHPPGTGIIKYINRREYNLSFHSVAQEIEEHLSKYSNSNERMEYATQKRWIELGIFISR